MRILVLSRRLWRFVQHENLHRLLGLISLLMLLSALGLTWSEPDMSFGNALWWSIVTLTTVGYGDISPETLGGRAIAITVMIMGIGLLGMCSAAIATVLVVSKMKEDRGMHAFLFEQHLILCTWNPRARMIWHELRADPHMATAPMVLIAELDHKPVDDDYLFFVQGAVNDETLRRANLAGAKTVVILGQDGLDATTRDAQVVLITLTVESINPQAYTIVELVDPAHAPFCERAHADEIIVGSELSSRLISRATLHHGMSKVISELLSARYGNELYSLTVPAALIGRPFLEVFIDIKQRYDSIVVAVQHGEEGEVLTNPPGAYCLVAGDRLIVVAQELPHLGS
jgi:voltage-gated potassium channel